MKKTVSLILAVVMLAGMLTGCNSVNASEEAVSIGMNAISVADRYLDGSMDADDAIKKLDDLYDRMEYVDDLTPDDEYYHYDFGVRAHISSLRTYIYLDDYAKIKSTRNELAKDVGEDKR